MKRRGSNSSRKIWVAVSTPFQVNYFYPLIKKLEKKYDFLITARDHDNIFSMLDAKGLDYTSLGKHGGSKLEGKLRSYTENVQKLIPIIKREKPDLLLTERWPAAVRTAFGFNIPAWTLFYDEREYHVNRLVFPLSSKVFSPRFYTPLELRGNGVDPEKVVWFNGFHTCYLKDKKISQNNMFKELGFEPPIIIVRPEPEFATFFDQKREVLSRAVSLLADNKNDFNIVVFPRTEEQALYYSKRSVKVMTNATSENPIFHADVIVGAAETMLMEAFVLCKPAISTVYWPESKPVIELHKHIPHLTDPKEVVARTLEFLNYKEKLAFSERAKLVVDLMENPLQKMEAEINNFFSEPKPSGVRSKRRSRMEIRMTILQAIAFKPLKITHIMQHTNISHSSVKKDIRWLTERGLIEVQRDFAGNEYFKTTVEGIKLLNNYKKMEEKLLK